MARKLRYLEPNPDTALEENVDFECICPESSVIVQHQVGELASLGLTLVILLDCSELSDLLHILVKRLGSIDDNLKK